MIGVEIWSDAGWDRGPYSYPPQAGKPQAHAARDHGSGVIDVTDDHSLLTLEGHEIAPKVLRPGDRILHSQLPPLERRCALGVCGEASRAEPPRFRGFPSWILGQPEDLRRMFLDNISGELESQEIRRHSAAEGVSQPDSDRGRGGFHRRNPHEGLRIRLHDGEPSLRGRSGKDRAHNTDSVYLRPPDHYYEEIDAAYHSGKITKMEHWTKMVEISLDICQGFGKEINNMISSYTGNTYLRMEDEGVKFPMLMTGKKKYAGIAHKPGGSTSSLRSCSCAASTSLRRADAAGDNAGQQDPAPGAAHRQRPRGPRDRRGHLRTLSLMSRSGLPTTSWRQRRTSPEEERLRPALRGACAKARRAHARGERATRQARRAAAAEAVRAAGAWARSSSVWSSNPRACTRSTARTR